MVEPDAGTLMETKKRKREITIRHWQARWNHGGKGDWTNRILPYLGRWLGRPQTGLSFHPRRHLSGTDVLPLFIANSANSVEHLMFHCPWWDEDRNPIKNYLRSRDVHPENVQDILCGPEDIPVYIDSPAAHIRNTEALIRCRELFNMMVEKILIQKEANERATEAEARQ